MVPSMGEIPVGRRRDCSLSAMKTSSRKVAAPKKKKPRGKGYPKAVRKKLVEAPWSVTNAVVGAHLEYWGLHSRPFENVPNPKDFVLFKSHKVALDLLAYTVRERKVAALLTGEYGTGKTTAIRVLLSELPLDDIRVAVLDHPILEERTPFASIYEQIGDGAVAWPENRLYELLGVRFLQLAREGKHSLVIVDEAQLLPLELLEKLRLLLNFQLNDRNLVTLILVGSDELWETLSRLPQLVQRLAVKCRLEHFQEAETCTYVARRLEKSGGQLKIFSKAALQLIHERSKGIARNINNICDLALVMAFHQETDTIEVDTIKTQWV